MRRFALVAMPILSVVTILLGLYFLYVGGRIAISGRHVGLGLGFAAFGALGFILAFALWNVRRQILGADWSDERKGGGVSS
jgi:hypothetical protein